MKIKKRGRGRPRKNQETKTYRTTGYGRDLPEQPYQEQICVKVTKEQYRSLRKGAKTNKMTVAGYVRSLIEVEKEEENKEIVQ